MRKWKNRIVVLTTLLCLLSLNIAGLAQAQPVVQRLRTLKFQPQVTEREFIEALPSLLGLEHLLPISPTFNDYVSLLKEKDVIPPDFVISPDKPIRKGKAAVLVNNALGLEATFIEKIFWKGEKLVLIVARRYRMIPINGDVDPDEILSGRELAVICLRITDKAGDNPLPGADVEAILALRSKIEEEVITREEVGHMLLVSVPPTS